MEGLSNEIMDYTKEHKESIEFKKINPEEIEAI